MKAGKKKYARRVPSLCYCGRPAVAAGKKLTGGGSVSQTGCERCLSIEADFYGVENKRAGVKPPASRRRGQSYLDVARACDRWLRGRGLSSAVGHTYIDRLPD